MAAAAMGDALLLIRDGGIDAVVIDAHDSCAGVVELARSIDALPDAPPVVLVSSSPLAPEISARIGAAGFLPKPCEPGELAEVVRRFSGALRPVLVLEDDPTGPTRLLRARAH
jgi:CheY-like chemotaxis protein